jgi:FkbM family methyltransferase
MNIPNTLRAALAAVALVAAPRAAAQVPDVANGLAPSRSPYTIERPSADGTGRFYMGREIAHPMSHRGAAWLERPDREAEERPYAVVASLQLEDDDVVVDLGAGTGYYTRRLARAVPAGRVIAVDIQPEMLEILQRQVRAEGLDHVETVLATESDPGLQPNSVDLTLIVDAYHEFAYPREVMEAVFDATRPGGRVVLVEYRAEDPTVPIRPLHKMTEAQVRRELEAVGFRFVENLSFLPTQHFLVFER